MSMKYECWGYKNGSPHKMINVVANSKDEAIDQAWPRLRALGFEPEKVTAK